MPALKSILCAALFGCLTLHASAADPNYSYVGSWMVSSGPAFDFGNATSDTPDTLLDIPAYTAQQAAALLFGGLASDYVISTSQASVDHLAWYDVLGAGEQVLGESYAYQSSDPSFRAGLYASPFDTVSAIDPFFTFPVASAYVLDNGVDRLNYAFRVSAVPEPASLALLMSGLGVVGWARRRQKSPAADQPAARG
jgi:hypothetical protein